MTAVTNQTDRVYHPIRRAAGRVAVVKDFDGRRT